ncbi:MAG: recombination protein RecR [Chlorobi bacterium]|nr:recombination protein RecR [Chlorobiota bacterium]
MKDDVITRVLEAFKRLPGVGDRTARRFLFHLLERDRAVLSELAEALRELEKHAISCSICHIIDTVSPCSICSSHDREPIICVVSSSREAYAIEGTGTYKGKYHVLGGLISPVEGISPEDLFISDLKDRVINENIEEVIIALPSNTEGEITAHYVANTLQDTGVKITLLARGLSYGSDLEYTDPMTLERALNYRVPYERK